MVDSHNENGLKSLTAAASNKDFRLSQEEIVRELLKHGANVERANNNGCTPLKIAATNEHKDVVRELLKHGSSV